MPVLLFLFVAGLAQALFLIGGLALIEVRNSTARWLLVALTVTFSVMLAETWWEAAWIPLGLGLGLAIELPLGPLLYFFLRALFDPEPPTIHRMAPHAIPLVMATLLLLWLHLAFPQRGISLSYPEMRSIVAGIVFVKIAVFFLYAAAIVRLPLPAAAGDRRGQVLRQLKLLLAVMSAAYALQAASFVAFLLRLPFMPDSDLIGGLLLTATLYAFGYFCFFNRDIFDLRDSYQGATLPIEEVVAIRARAIDHLRLTEAFRNPNFDLRVLAAATRVTPGKLSQALNACAGGGFAGLVNAFRLAAYRAARADPANRDRTVLQLAFDAGFNSSATFYRALRTEGSAPAAE